MKLRNNWRAGYAETCMSGSEGGSQKPGLATDQGAGFLPYKSTSATNIAFGMVGVLRKAERVQLSRAADRHRLAGTCHARHDRQEGLWRRQQPLHRPDGRSAECGAAHSPTASCRATWDADLHVLPASPMLEGAERELMGVAGAPYRLADPLSKIAIAVCCHRHRHPPFVLAADRNGIARRDRCDCPGRAALSGDGRLDERHRENQRHPRRLAASSSCASAAFSSPRWTAAFAGHNQLLDELKAHSVLGKLLLGVIPANEAVSYAHHQHQSLFTYSPEIGRQQSLRSGRRLARALSGEGRCIMPHVRYPAASMILLASVTEDMLGDLSQVLPDQEHSRRAHPAGDGASRSGATASRLARSHPFCLSQQSADADAGAARTGAARSDRRAAARTTVQQRARTAAARGR